MKSFFYIFIFLLATNVGAFTIDKKSEIRDGKIRFFDEFNCNGTDDLCLEVCGDSTFCKMPAPTCNGCSSYRDQSYRAIFLEEFLYKYKVAYVIHTQQLAYIMNYFEFYIIDANDPLNIFSNNKSKKIKNQFAKYCPEFTPDPKLLLNRDENGEIYVRGIFCNNPNSSNYYVLGLVKNPLLEEELSNRYYE